MLTTSKKIINYPKIGDITYKRNSRARRLSISINNSKGVRVTIPGTLSFRSAESFVLSKSEWIIEKVQYFNNRVDLIIQSGVYKTRTHTLIYFPVSSTKIVVKIDSQYINVFYPEQFDISNQQVQLAAKKGIENAYRIEAKEILPQRVEFNAQKYGFRFNRISIKRTTSRWGSCSSKNNINLSIFLMKLPDELIDYIIIHELCHTIHKNHGSKFWAALDQITGGNAKKFSKEVKKFKTGV
ncbi:MAG: M48 family metallopeptidase [Bacteroidales bacterium]|nr:M48 family metallopeptidase [Bacteroidales bacterium]